MHWKKKSKLDAQRIKTYPGMLIKNIPTVHTVLEIKKPQNNQYHKVRKIGRRASYYTQMLFSFSHYCAKLLIYNEEEKTHDKTQLAAIFNISTGLPEKQHWLDKSLWKTAPA